MSFDKIEVRVFSGPDQVQVGSNTKPDLVVINIGPKGDTGATGSTGPAGPNSVTSATTSDGTAILDVESITGIYIDGDVFTATSGTGTAVIGISNSGIGASFYSQDNYGAVIGSAGGNSLKLTSVSGDYYIECENNFTTIEAAIERVRGWFVWFYNTFTGRLKTADITANRDWTLPDASGTIALTTSNVATATALQNSRNIFGIAFNGTANVVGDATNTGHFASIPTGGQAGHFITLNGTAPTVIAGRSAWWSDGSGNPSFRNGTGTAVTLVKSSDLGTNVANFLEFPTSANLASALTDENGTGGGFVRAEGATLTSPALVGPVNLTSQDASTADRVMNRSLSDARAIKNRVEGKARIFSLLNLPTVVAGSVNHTTRPNSVEVLITAANTHSGYVFSELSLHSEWSGAGFNFARNFLCSGVFYLRGLGDQNGALRFYIGVPSSYRSNQASLATAGLCLEFRRNATTLEARLSYFSGTYRETAWVNVYNTGLYYTGVFRFVIRNTGNGNVAVYFLAGTDTGTTKPLPDIDGTPIISITNGPTTSAGANLVTAMCADSSLTPASNTQARIQHFDLELLS